MASAELSASGVTHNDLLSDDQSNRDAHHETATTVVPRNVIPSSTEDNECGDAKCTNYANVSPPTSNCESMMDDTAKGFYEHLGR